jgi:3-dehydroquinate dehydratase/shikimate dehydrogenase
MTLIVASIRVQSAAQTATDAVRAWAQGATAIELRLDTFGGSLDEIRGLLLAEADRTWIVTCRAPEEGGDGPADPIDRAKILYAVAHDTGAHVDIEFATFQASAVARKTALLAARKSGRTRLILSAHDFADFPDNPQHLLDAMSAVPEASAVKLAMTARDIRDAMTTLELLHAPAKPTIAIAMGEPGLISRVLAPKFDAFATYACLDGETATAPGQVTVADMVKLYRADRMTPLTRVFGVIGAPVAHSMSPALHNAWFEAAGLDAVYLPLLVDARPGVLSDFLDAARRMDELDAGGFSVTVPHKEAAARYAGPHADDTAQRIGAVNTLMLAPRLPRAVFDPERGGFVRPLRDIAACNTDADAAVASLCDALGGEAAFHGLTVDVLGTGGAARAIVASLAPLGCRVTVYGRDEAKTEQLCEAFGATSAPWDVRLVRRGRLVIQTTSVGMWPKVEDTPLPPEALGACDLVFDVIYHPRETRLLRLAAQAGARTLDGLAMFLGQAARQFEAWTGQTPDMELGRRVVLDRLHARESESSPS